ncbi:hypothetical protein QUO16_004493 [Vibrio parahaemolyticus]|uniref:hypothetical protein n=1 Tax=Vibrio parahaemolyticus TaxID=670 RepID=UPI000A39544D|nr:hypothetical protein [Vibrio parahaemolyticus]ELA9373169.1 hypothetical protein [Vibrio parahaemolyticus]OUJ46647.1 hypothetical protein BTM22_24815 [Vibrio parahaemolyticus]TOE56374.1 hypothetical protein CGJ40_23340 [Vibrio parahaemolyticus]
MPRKLRLNSLTADKSAVEKLLQESIEYGDFVGELQYQERLNELSNEISALQADVPTNASVALFFGGEPVLGSHGISASFAGNALDKFQTLINKTFANKESGALGERGKVPLKRNSNLMVTQVVKGSFGFVLDEISDQIEITETALKSTVEDVLNMINTSAQNDEALFEELIDSLDKRILQSLKEFFEVLDKAHSTIRIVGDEQEYNLDSNLIHRARKRVESTDITECDEVITITLTGYLPEHCKFEGKLEDGSFIYGTVSKQASKQYTQDYYGSKLDVLVQKKVIKPLNGQERELIKIKEFKTAYNKAFKSDSQR